MALTVEQQEMLRARFVHADLPFCACLFHPDQPAGGQMPIGGVMFPAVLMASNVAWFPDQEHRPDMPKPRGDGTFAKMKTKASKGLRHLLVDDTGAQELLIVEGEGDAFAARSVGLIGVVCAGGTSTLLNDSPAAAEQRRKVFAGKSLRFAFDPDEAGRAAVVERQVPRGDQGLEGRGPEPAGRRRRAIGAERRRVPDGASAPGRPGGRGSDRLDPDAAHRRRAGGSRGGQHRVTTAA